MRSMIRWGLLALLLAPVRLAWARASPRTTRPCKRIWSLGMDSSQVGMLAQALDDSIGPRLTGSPGIKAGQ